MRLMIIVFIALMQGAVFAEVITTKAESFEQIGALYAQEITDPKEALLVFDIDDTLLTMSQPLGGVAWWDWQSDLLKNHPNSDRLFVQSFAELVGVQNLLFRIVKMEPTDEFVLPFLNQSTSQGASIMGLTARGSEHLSVTMMELNDNGFKDTQDHFIFKQNGMRLKNGETSSAGDFKCDALTRSTTYNQGVLFLDGQNKGQALLCVLKEAAKHYSSIIFVDDVAHNLDAVGDAFKDVEGIKVINVLYTREHAKEKDFLSNPSLQEIAFNQWQTIKNAFKESIVHSNF